MKRISSIFTAAVFLVLLSACTLKKPLDVITGGLGIDVSTGKEIAAFDAHGGFHGDGTAYIVLKFTDDMVVN